VVLALQVHYNLQVALAQVKTQEQVFLVVVYVLLISQPHPLQEEIMVVAVQDLPQIQ
jgi:hypothetical protein